MKPKKYTLLGVLSALALVVVIATSFLTSAQAAETDGTSETLIPMAQEETVTEVEANQEADLQTIGNDVNVTSSLKLIWPTESVTLSSTFGQRVHPVTGEIKQYDHINIKGEQGDNVYAAISGTVMEATYISSYGNYITIANGDGLTTMYSHLQDISVAAGDTVTAGDVIGTVGATGLATGPNLGFWVTENGTAVDPMGYFE